MDSTIAQLDFPANAAEAIRSVCYSGLNYRNDYYQQSLPVYMQMVNLAFHAGCQSILELGAGLSTALWARFASRTGAEVTTIDADFSPMRSYIQSSSLQRLIDRNIRLRQGVSITAEELEAFYTSEHTQFGGISISALADTLEHFQQPAPQLRMDRLREAVGGDDTSINDIFLPDRQTLRYPAAVLDKLSPSGRFAKDVSFLASHPLANFNRHATWDLIFFDSGEYSSSVEWLMLKDCIAINGFAVFHDIFFPKSVKNFLPCAAIAADPNWRVVLLDDSTIQGLLIAQRLK